MAAQLCLEFPGYCFHPVTESPHCLMTMQNLEAGLQEEVYTPIERWHKLYQNIKVCRPITCHQCRSSQQLAPCCCPSAVGECGQVSSPSARLRWTISGNGLRPSLPHICVLPGGKAPDRVSCALCSAPTSCIQLFLPGTRSRASPSRRRASLVWRPAAWSTMPRARSWDLHGRRSSSMPARPTAAAMLVWTPRNAMPRPCWRVRGPPFHRASLSMVPDMA